MAFATLEDTSGKAELIIFPRTYESVMGKIEQDSVILVRGRVGYEDEEFKIFAEKISIPKQEDVDFESSQNFKEIFVPRKTEQSTLKKLGALLKSRPGKEKVVIVIPNGAKPEKIILPYKIDWTDTLVKEVEALLK
jgi:DNA polymerase-3 subunit alpha